MREPDRCILHLDMDAFYASVEQHDFSELRGKPVIVGGNRQRGVVCAASYEVRPFGVRSAMAMARALQLCPQAAVRPVRMQRYQEVSRQIFAIFSRFTDAIEPLSIDEAFLDVTGSRALFGSGEEIARQIRLAVRNETGLTVSAGIAPNKFLAKLASEAAKPDGLHEVRREEIDAFLRPLPVAALWGVGRVTREKLAAMGIRTVAELRRLPSAVLEKRLGAAGLHLFQLARGEDERPVTGGEDLKSVGHEDTYAADLCDANSITREILHLSERVAARLRRHGVQGRCVTLKVKFSDFSVVTRSRTLEEGLSNGGQIHREALKLLAKTEAGRRPVRLLGVSLSALEPLGAGQGNLFAADDRERIQRLDRAVDRVRERFGSAGVIKGTLLSAGDDSGGEEGADID